MLGQWSLIENDLQDRGIDVGDDTLMAARSWRWLRTRILGLLDVAPVYYPIDGKPPVRIFPTRLARHFHTDD